MEKYITNMEKKNICRDFIFTYSNAPALSYGHCSQEVNENLSFINPQFTSTSIKIK